MQPISSRRRSNTPTEALRALAVAGILLATAASPALAEDAPDTAKLWTKHCQSCHGPDGKGKTKAGEKAKVRDLTAADVKSALTKEKAVEAIRVGVKEKDGDKMVMKAYADKLSEAEIQALAEHSLKFQ